MSFRAHLRPVIAATLLLVAAGSGTAAAAGPLPASSSGPSLSAQGDVELAPGLEVFHVDTDSQTSGSTTTGQFTGTGELKAGPVNLPIPLSIAGPVTCLTVRGNTAAFLYPIKEAQPPLLANLLVNNTSVLFTVTKGNNGLNHVGFVGPLPSGFFHGCQPTGTPFVFHGTVDITR
jgi:hypothetical protein